MPAPRKLRSDDGNGAYTLSFDHDHDETQTKVSALTMKSALPFSMYENPDYLTQPTVIPWFTIIITVAQLCLYIGYLFVTNDFQFSASDASTYNAIGGPSSMWLMSVSPFSECDNLHAELWRYISYVMIHGNLAHLLTNMFMQCILGTSLESVHGFWRVALLYVTAGIAGGLNVTMFTPNLTVVGASGAIYGLIGVCTANLVLNWEEMPLRWYRMAVLVFFVVNEGAMYYYSYDPFTSYCAHAGGFAFGLLFSFPILKNLRVTCCERGLNFICLLLACSICFVWFSWYLAHPIPSAAIINDRKNTCCTNILRYGLPLDGSVNGDYQCVTYEKDSATLLGLDDGVLYQVNANARAGEEWVDVSTM